MATGGSLTGCELEGVEEIKMNDGSNFNAGSYGCVFEVKMGENVFIAKKPHTIFLTQCS